MTEQTDGTETLLRDEMTRLNNEVATCLHKRLIQSRKAVRMAITFLRDIPEGFLGNGAVSARVDILDLLDRADDHYISAEKSVLDKYGVEAGVVYERRSEVT